VMLGIGEYSRRLSMAMCSSGHISLEPTVEGPQYVVHYRILSQLASPVCNWSTFHARHVHARLQHPWDRGAIARCSAVGLLCAFLPAASCAMHGHVPQ
jgi:hypothetical protein